MISKKLAQDIVDKMMKVIPYNVNIMNSDGIIIGSGDVNRLGKVHEGALEAIRKNEIVEIYEDKGEIKRGVNIPISFRKTIVGTIGITGGVNKVRQFGKLVSVTAELLINQEYSINEHIIKEKLREEFLFEWINYVKNYEENFIEKAKSFSIDILIKRVAVSIKYKENNYKDADNIFNYFLSENEYIIHESSSRAIVLLEDNNYIERRIKKLIEKLDRFNVLIGIGNSSDNINVSVKQSRKSLEIGKRIYEEKNVYRYNEIAFLHEMEYMIRKEDEILKKIVEESKNNDLFETFLTFMECHGERTLTAKRLHIHRNTLNYRLEKIEEITNLNFNNYIELFQMIKSYLNYKLS